VTIRALRILPPLAIARLGSAPTPLDNFATEVDPENPLDFRRIVPKETLVVDDKTGKIGKSWTPPTIEFKEDGRIRPVAPFLEVFAETGPDTLEPLTLDLLAREGLGPDNVTWDVAVANRKVARRTGDPRDVVGASVSFSDHASYELEGHCQNFVSTSAFIRFGAVRYIEPTTAFPQIRLRFTPAQGLIYGANKVDDKVPGEDKWITPERRVYDAGKGNWFRFEVPYEVDWGGGRRQAGQRFWNETLPPSLFAIVPPAPSWLHGNVAISRGYLDDACDGIVSVGLSSKDGKQLFSAAARITAGPPMLIPDARFVRSLADDLEQVISGPDVPANEPLEVTQARAEEIVRRAYETARFLNIAVMNGDPVQGRSPLDFDTMPAEEAFDTNRLMRPVMAEGSVDTLAVLALHQQVFAALRGRAAPWFVRLLRRPDAVVDFTDDGRRKMPALMCGADGSYLALTHHQISTIERVAEAAPFEPPADAPAEATPEAPLLTPRNLTAQIEYVAAGNPASSRPSSAIANCCPGLEVDFRAVWRRMFKGIVLREYDNLVVATDAGAGDVISGLVGHRLLRVNCLEMMGTMIGPSPADPAEPVVLSTEENPHALAPLEWSNALAAVLNAGGKATCDFTREESWYEQQPWTDDEDHITLDLEVRPFFEAGTAFISQELAQPGELTQGLCSPWQNDFRECSCYYWASARPDFVNVEPSPTGGSAGDNWLQKVRTGSYVPDDYVDARLLTYDDLFESWEHWLRFQIGGRDAPGETDGRA
jgi:hypothetical protein